MVHPQIRSIKFEYPFDGTTDMQMTAVKTDHAHFMTMWNTPNGDIMN